MACHQQPKEIIHPLASSSSQNNQPSNGFNIPSDIESDLRKISKYDESGIKFLDSLGHTQVFGLISHSELTKDNVFILDSRQQFLYQYNLNGELISYAGGRGEGPGNLNAASDFAVYEDSLLFIPNVYRIEVFNFDDELKYHSTISNDFTTASICISNNKFFIHRTQLLDEIVEQGFSQTINSFMRQPTTGSLEPIGQFNKTYKSTSSLVTARLSRGHLQCSDESVLFIYDKLPEVRTYNSNTEELMWDAFFKKFEVFKIIEHSLDGKPALNYSQPESGILDRFLKFNQVQDDVYLFQIDRRDFSGSEHEPIVLSYLLDINSGEFTELNIELPRILAMDHNQKYAIATNKDFNEVFAIYF
jgi:hypothetical protein